MDGANAAGAAGNFSVLTGLFTLLGGTGFCGVLIAYFGYRQAAVSSERKNGETMRDAIAGGYAQNGPDPAITALSLLTAAVTECTVQLKKIVAFNTAREEAEQLKHTVEKILKDTGAHQ